MPRRLTDNEIATFRASREGLGASAPASPRVRSESSTALLAAVERQVCVCVFVGS